MSHRGACKIDAESLADWTLQVNRTEANGGPSVAVRGGFNLRLNASINGGCDTCLALGKGLLTSARGGSEFFDNFDIRPLRGGAGRGSTRSSCYERGADLFPSRQKRAGEPLRGGAGRGSTRSCSDERGAHLFPSRLRRREGRLWLKLRKKKNTQGRAARGTYFISHQKRRKRR